MNPLNPVKSFYGDPDLPLGVKIALTFLALACVVGLGALVYGLIIGEMAAYVVGVILLIIAAIAAVIRVVVWFDEDYRDYKRKKNGGRY